MLRTLPRALQGVLSVLLASAIALGQNDLVAPPVLPAPPVLLQQFDVMAGTVQHLQVPNGQPNAALIDVVFAGVVQRLDLVPHEVRAPGFQLFERTATGLQLLPTPPCATYRGAIVGDAGSEIAATIAGGSVTAWARTGAGDLWIVQPVRDVQPNAGPGVHVVFRSIDSANMPEHCGVVGAAAAAPQAILQDVLYACQLAIEADYPFFQLNGSNTTNTQNDVTGIVNAMDVIYRRDVQIAMVVSQLIVDSAPDPYTSSVPGTLLNQFGSRWNTTYAGVARDVAHLFTGRNMAAASGGVVGLAFLSVVCNIGNAYGVSQSRFTANAAYRVGVTAHEIGHNFGAGHCDASPPCNIMCSGIGGCTNNPTAFGVGEQNQIIAYRQSVSCLALLPTTPVITSVLPLSIKTFRPPLVTLTGTGFTGVTILHVGNQFVNNGISILSDTQLRFTPPRGMPLGAQVVNATNSAGTSNNAVLLYTAANPCEISVPGAVLGGNTLTWDLGGWNGDFAFLVISLVNTTTPWQGYPLLDGFSVIWSGGLDARGMASYSIPIPAGVLNGLRAYTEMIDITGSTLTVRSVSGISSTLVVL
ncbi:MAG: M12 family metallo-peptidase [Planctomycetota bacterium]|nr:M12 family metallo-peptidase [Planctomycetota bacterium]